MTDRFKQAVDKVSELPDDHQDAIAALMLWAVQYKYPLGLTMGLGFMPGDFDESLEKETSCL